MITVLFHESVFGPVNSRRLGTSLGINLLPNDGKVCSFDCIYCEVGYNSQGSGKSGIPKREHVKKLLDKKLKEMSDKGENLDVITFAGNGEPTVHPQFREIVSDTIKLRDRYFPAAKVSVLSNSSFLGNEKVVEALKMVDNNILKLDSAISRTMTLLNAPVNKNVMPEGIITDIKQFNGKCILQTLFVRGEHNGQKVDNTTDKEIDALIAAYKEINPEEIMIYSIDRATPEENLEKISAEELGRIADRISKSGLNVKVD